MKKVRVDELLADKGLAPSRERAAALVMAGVVYAGDTKILKPGQAVSPDANLEVRGKKDHPYVSRGGVKLSHAFGHFGVDPKDMVCMDVGASTGGFTDCLLQNGAKKVYAIDVGYGQLALKVAGDERVVVIERTNIRAMTPENIPDLIDIVVIDVSFISLTLVMPVVDVFLRPGALLVVLIKPQFEVGRELVGSGGIVRDTKSHEFAIEKVKKAGESLGFECRGLVESPILGAKGNKEFLMHFVKKGVKS